MAASWCPSLHSSCEAMLSPNHWSSFSLNSQQEEAGYPLHPSPGMLPWWPSRFWECERKARGNTVIMCGRSEWNLSIKTPWGPRTKENPRPHREPLLQFPDWACLSGNWTLGIYFQARASSNLTLQRVWIFPLALTETILAPSSYPSGTDAVWSPSKTLIEAFQDFLASIGRSV